MSDPEKCARCGVIGHDRRTLWMACLYQMSELGLPFESIGLRGAMVERIVGRKLMPWGVTDEWSQTWRDRDKGDEIDRNLRPFYTLTVCKGCRGEWMRAIRDWFRAPPGDISRWNNDEADEAEAPEPLAELMARLENLRTEALALMHRIDDTTNSTREELDRRHLAASRPATSEGKET